MTEKELLKQLEKELNKHYKDTESVLRTKIDDFTKNFDKNNKLQLKLLNDGKISEKEYKTWYKEQVTTAKWSRKMIDELSNDIANANVKASELINRYTSEIYLKGCIEASVEFEDMLGFDLINRKQINRLLNDNKSLLPKVNPSVSKDKLWNQRRMKSAVLQSALKGESIPKLAKRLEIVVGMNKTSAMRNARTMMTASHNQGKLDMGYEAAEMGIKLQKKWLATFDDRTRDSHIEMHGEIVDFDEEFSNGLMFPADPDGDDPAEIYNCRCTYRYVHDEKRSGISREEFQKNVDRVKKLKEERRRGNQN